MVDFTKSMIIDILQDCPIGLIPLKGEITKRTGYGNSYVTKAVKEALKDGVIRRDSETLLMHITGDEFLPLEVRLKKYEDENKTLKIKLEASENMVQILQNMVQILQNILTKFGLSDKETGC